MEVLGWIGAAQGLFASILMFTKKEQSVSDKILSAWLMLFAIEFMTFGFDYTHFGYSMLSSSFLLFNPALFLYVRSLVYKDFQLKFSMLLHLLPFISFETYAYIIQTPFSFRDFFSMDEAFIFRILFGVSTIVSLLVYIPLSLRKISKYRKKLQDETSNINQEQSLSWVTIVTLSYVIYSIIAMLFGSAILLFGIDNTISITIYNYVVLLIFIYMLSFYGLRQVQIQIQTEDEDNKSVSYKSSTLSVATKKEIENKIYHYVGKNRAYLNPNLNMDLLSKSTGYPKYQLTEVLNTAIGSNFFQFVNNFRVEEVKKRLLEPVLLYSIEAIGYECGFSSKSSFYSVFKKNTGETPISYRKRVLGE